MELTKHHFMKFVFILVLIVVFSEFYFMKRRNLTYFLQLGQIPMNTVGEHAAIQSALDAFRQMTVDTQEPHVLRQGSGKFSKLFIDRNKLLVHENGKTYIMVYVDLFDENRQRIDFGGEIVVIRAVFSDGSVVSADVTDQFNGSYSGRILMVAPGRTNISAELAEPFRILYEQKLCFQKYGRTLASKTLYARFSYGNYIEDTMCLPLPDVGLESYSDLCNLTQENYGLSLYCGKPLNPNIQCSDVKYFTFEENTVSHADTDMLPVCKSRPREKIFRKLTPFVINIPGRHDEPIKFLSELAPCSTRSKTMTWSEPFPSGYLQNGTWQFLYCKSAIKPTRAEYRACLENKHIVLFGDSTLRQWYKYFITMFDLKFLTEYWDMQSRINRFTTVYDSAMGFNLSWAPHEMPFQHGFWMEKGSYRAVSEYLNEIASLKSDKNNHQHLVIVIGIGFHFQKYDPMVYIEHVRKIVDSVNTLLENKPETNIFLKSPHTRGAYLHMNKIYLDILKDEYKRLYSNVTFLNQWDVTITHSDYATHSVPRTLSNMIYQFMANLCTGDDYQ